MFQFKVLKAHLNGTLEVKYVRKTQQNAAPN